MEVARWALIPLNENEWECVHQPGVGVTHTASANELQWLWPQVTKGRKRSVLPGHC